MVVSLVYIRRDYFRFPEIIVAWLLFAHHPIYAEPAGAYEQDGKIGGQEKQGGFVRRERRALVKKKGGYPHLYNHDQGGETGEEAERYQERRKYFGQYGEDEGPAVTDMKRIEEAVFELAEML